MTVPPPHGPEARAATPVHAHTHDFNDKGNLTNNTTAPIKEIRTRTHLKFIPVHPQCVDVHVRVMNVHHVALTLSLSQPQQ